MVSGGPGVLVVHGDSAVCQTLGALVEEAAGEVAHANSAGEAIRQASSAPPDVVVLAWELPDMSGVDALSLLRPGSPDAYVVMFSTAPQPGAAPQAVAAGADDYVEIADGGALAARVVEARQRGHKQRPDREPTGGEPSRRSGSGTVRDH